MPNEVERCRHDPIRPLAFGHWPPSPQGEGRGAYIPKISFQRLTHSSLAAFILA